MDDQSASAVDFSKALLALALRRMEREKPTHLIRPALANASIKASKALAVINRGRTASMKGSHASRYCLAMRRSASTATSWGSRQQGVVDSPAPWRGWISPGHFAVHVAHQPDDTAHHATTATVTAGRPDVSKPSDPTSGTFEIGFLNRVLQPTAENDDAVRS